MPPSATHAQLPPQFQPVQNFTRDMPPGFPTTESFPGLPPPLSPNLSSIPPPRPPNLTHSHHVKTNFANNQQLSSPQLDTSKNFTFHEKGVHFPHIPSTPPPIIRKDTFTVSYFYLTCYLSNRQREPHMR